MKYFIFLIIFTCNALALDAVVTVLEAPMFESKNLDAQVVQYLRKGDVIKVHPSLANEVKYDYMRAENTPVSKLEKENTFYFEDEFIPTIDRQGKTAYVLSEHIYVYTNDSREFTQIMLERDPTDYRLKEPLPKGYPIRQPSGLRGQLLLGFAQTYTESYPYADNVKTKGYMTPIDLKAVLLKQVPYDLQERFYFGGTLNFRTYTNNYHFFDKRYSEERGVKLGLGPYITYDAYKGHKDRINLYGAIVVYLFNQLTVAQSTSAASDKRTYLGFNLSPQIGLQYHRKQIHESIDFVLGTAIESETPTTYNAKNAGSQSGWWQDLGNDKFTTRATFSIAGYIGLQSSY